MRTDKWGEPLDLAEGDGAELLVAGGVIKNYSPSPAVCVLTKPNVVDCTIRFSGALIEGGGTGITCRGASDYYIAGGTIVSGCTDYGIRASSSISSARPNVYLIDSIIRDCGTGVYAHGAGDPNVQVNGSQFIDCTTDTVGVNRSSQ